MQMLTKAIEKRLPAMMATEKVALNDKVLVVKFFCPWSHWTWYGVEYDPIDKVFFGYVEGDEKEWGDFSLDELTDVTGPIGMKIERDLYWKPTKFKDLRK
jgi:hypothetical protein